MARLDKDDQRERSALRISGLRQITRRQWLFAALWAFLLIGGVLAYFALTLPPTGDLTASERRPSVTMVTEDGTLIATFGDLFGEPVHLKDLPRYVPQAVIATEDRRFYHHFGVDPLGLLRAAFANLRAGHVVQGGSTITQQLAKNLFLTPERTVPRKIRETMLALWLEHKFTKNQILELYLNRVYLGAGTYGVDAAAQRYFDKPAKELSLYEAAVIAGLL
jgi:penicillin-binding protein 1A